MRPDIRLITCKTILTPTKGTGFLNSFTHTCNPYQGCAFGSNGCGIYCYVRRSPVGLFGRAPWGAWVDVKENAPGRLARELAREPHPERLRVFMASATDPYQPVERMYELTRQLLTVFRSRPVGLLVVQTRGPLVERDFDLLAAMPFAWLSMTCETDDDEARKRLTPACPAIFRRIAVMRRARAAGINVQATVSPLLPHDPDRFADLLAGVADRVIVDTFVDGDGANGRRTAALPLPERYRALGWGDWRDRTAAQELYALLQARLGPTRVGYSQAGFNGLENAQPDP